MPTTADPQSYPNPAWGRPWGNQSSGNQSSGNQSPWGSQSSGNQGWSPPPFWHPEGISRPFGIAAMVLGFALWWPVGLALLFFMIFSGRLGCGRRRWAHAAQGQTGSTWQSCVPPWANWCAGAERKPQTSGNHAFDEYRAETLRRLEEEQNEFSSFLERLRFAKDKAEFDQFMAERRQTPRPPTVPDEPQQG
jgi:hypothetical protein